ncbi:MAG: DASS family sodium-coupled anion symporter, partial [Phascolarctobacterium sp.]|nr:DASS family sodium-coupled anion symporter [Candidatus Phascolarctobacterium equi]
MSKKMQQLLMIFVIGAVIWFIPVPAGVKPAAWHLLAIFVATIVGFILHPLPIGAIALMAASLAGFLKVLKPAEALKGYGDATIWLIVSAYLFALGFVKTGLGKRIAYNIMAAIGDSSLKLGYAMALSDLIVSPATPSNTARAGGIIFPIVKSLAVAFKSEPGETARKIGSYLMKSSFQVNCVTSSMFITAVAPNALAVSLAAKATGVEITWGQWAMACIVPGLICVLLVPTLVYKLYPPEITHTPEAKEIAHKELTAMGPMSKAEKIVLFVFILSLGLWATASYTKLNATMIAMVGVCIMLIGGAIEWEDVITQKGAWDTLIW